MKKISKKIIASALALAMTVAGSVVTFADTEMPKPEGSAVISEDSSSITVTVSASGDFVAGFDYGVAYDSEKVAIKSLALSDEFKAFLEKNSGINQSANNAALSYVVIGGVVSDTDPLTGAANDTNYSGVVGSVTFTVKEGVDATTAQFAVVSDSATIAKEQLAEGQNMLQFAQEKEDIAPIVPSTPAPVETEAPATTTAPADETEAPATTTAPAATTTTAPADVKPSEAAKTTAPAKTTAAAPAATTKTSPKTGDAGVVLPIVAICGAAAAVAVASKKKVED